MLYTTAGPTGLGFADVQMMLQALIPAILKGPSPEPAQVNPETSG